MEKTRTININNNSKEKAPKMDEVIRPVDRVTSAVNLSG